MFTNTGVAVCEIRKDTREAAMSEQMIEDLIQAARQAAGRAYAPYSKFPVGTALLGENGRVYTGCNVENASYGLTVCAERAALVRAVADGCRRFQAIAIYTPTPKPTPPCGACRQTLNEFSPEAQVICACDGTERLRSTVAELLPAPFGDSGSESQFR